MRRPRITLARLMGLVLYCGVVFGTLRYATEIWASALFTLMLLLLLAAVVCAIFCKEPARAGWLGFAIFGWGFFLVGYNGGIVPQAGATPVLTSLLFKTLHERAIPAPEQAGLNGVTAFLVQNQGVAWSLNGTAPPPQAAVSSNLFFNITGAPPAVQGSPSLENFVRVGAAHATFLCALFGAALARWLQCRQERLGEKSGTAAQEFPLAPAPLSPT
jgi:hypothetical protein